MPKPEPRVLVPGLSVAPHRFDAAVRTLTRPGAPAIQLGVALAFMTRHRDLLGHGEPGLPRSGHWTPSQLRALADRLEAAQR